MKLLTHLLPALLMLGLTPAAPGEGFDHSHARYAKVLASHVKDARVNYAALKTNPEELDAYLDEIASVPPDAFKQWTKSQQLALLLNLYNAHTLKRIIKHYPVDSIRDIGLLPGAAWRIQDVRFGDQLLTLDHLEHKIIRPDYDEPRIHFALVCAALSCPPLRGEPYLAAKLDAQLDEQARLFLAHSAKNRFDPETNTLWLSAIFEWYSGDFGDLIDYAEKYLPMESARALRSSKKVKVRFIDYDWSLNSQ